MRKIIAFFIVLSIFVLIPACGRNSIKNIPMETSVDYPILTEINDLTEKEIIEWHNPCITEYDKSSGITRAHAVVTGKYSVTNKLVNNKTVFLRLSFDPGFNPESLNINELTIEPTNIKLRIMYPSYIHNDLEFIDNLQVRHPQMQQLLDNVMDKLRKRGKEN